MMGLDVLLLRAATLAYFVATAAALSAVVRRRAMPARIMTGALGVGSLVHVAGLAAHARLAGHFAATNFGEALSFVAVLLVAIFLGLQARRPLVALGAVVSPLAFGFSLAASVVYDGARPLPPILDSVWLPVHVVMAFLGDAVFAIAASASLLYLVQERRLKSRRANAGLELPSLEALDRLNHGCLVWGLVLLTVGIVSGIVWAHQAWGRELWTSDPKVVLSLVVWALYVVLLQGRMTVGWRGRWAAQLTIAGFAVMLLSFVSVNMLAVGMHGRGF